MVKVTDHGVILGPVSAADRIANAGFFQDVIDAVFAAGGGEVTVPGGRIELDGTLQGKYGVNVRGEGAYGTRLVFYNDEAGVAVDLRGPGGGLPIPADRVVCTWSDLTLDGQNGHDALEAVRLGYNYRSDPILARIRIFSFGHYAIHFLNDNWNVSLVDVELDACGKRTSNSCGIYKNPSISDLNYINFTRVQIEGCGRSDSAAGGLNIQSSSLMANRCWQFTDCIIEGNSGTDEAYFSNMRSVNFDNLYLEREPPDQDGGEQVTGMEFSNVTGKISGGVAVCKPLIPQFGLQFKNGCDFSVRDVEFGTWGTVGIDIHASQVHTGRNSNPSFRLDDSAQPRGIHAPRFTATRAPSASSDQSVPDAAPTRVLLDTTDYDVTSAFDTANSRYRPQSTGQYSFQGAVTFNNVSEGARVTLAIYVNGLPARSCTHLVNGAGEQSFTIAGDVGLSATSDYVELYVTQNSGMSRDIARAVKKTWFSGSIIQ